MPTPHIEAEKGAFAETVLLPGDPLRAKFIAKTFLEEVQQVNGVRNMFGFTGSYRGTPVSVMGSGMGIPSISIYAKELITDYGVKNLIRVGSCGAVSKKVKVRDVLIGMGGCTDSGVSSRSEMPGGRSPPARIPRESPSIILSSFPRAKPADFSRRASPILSLLQAIPSG